jgi:hypothetical protein
MAISPKPRAPPVRLTPVLDRTGAFDVALSICSGVIFLGPLSYLFVVKDPTDSANEKLKGKERERT